MKTFTKPILEPFRIPLLILEGPAGAGKTYLAKHLIDHNLLKQAPVLATLPRPRSYGEAESPAALSMMKDHCRFIEAITFFRQTPTHPLLLDRWVLSQLVYGSLRRDSYITGSQAYYYLMTSLLQAFHMWDELYARDGQIAPAVALDVTFCILRPTIERLEYHRSKADREFPFEASRELNHYSTLAYLLRSTLGNKIQRDLREDHGFHAVIDTWEFTLADGNDYAAMYDTAGTLLQDKTQKLAY